MCYICNCLVWSMDVIQRTITFCITSILMCIMCMGFSICIIAGIAYGYNYSLAEFITFTRSDVSVYMRRGQMNDRKDLAQFEPGRRRISDETDSFSNISTDYQDTMISTGDKKPLSETLIKSQDTRKYAERLSKFSNTLTSKRYNEEELEVPEGSVSYFRFTTPPVNNRISINPNPAIQTTVVQSGSSAIVMRKFPPMKDISSEMARKDPDEYFYKVSDMDERDKIKSKMKIHGGESSEEISDDNEKLHEVSTSLSIPMRHFEGVPDIDEENIAYKPV